MLPNKRITPANHHWWPQSLSKSWVGADGGVTQLSWDESEVRSKPSNFAAIRNAHHITRGNDSPWNTTFEPVFDKADSTFPDLVDWLLTIEASTSRSKSSFHDRFRVQSLSGDRRAQLAECLSSLVVRSPRSRNNIKITIESYLSNDNIEEHYVDKTLIAANMHASHGIFTSVINGGGRFIALICDESELVYGDGFLHNFPIGTDRPISGRFIIPVLPSLAILFVQPLAYRPQPELITMRLHEKEVTFLNQIVQVYSKNHIFYRNIKPKIIEEFRRREHLELTYHQHPWIEHLINSALDFVPKV
ncbi:MAG: DUF4238 domain-containing protein [Hyphomicrobiales bacterium]|nr:DUF4238 domain-containing protein [Hyphomicrobiales bacterium]